MMAALAVVGAILMGCAGEDMANEAPQAKSGNKVIQTTTISLGAVPVPEHSMPTARKPSPWATR